MKSDTPQAQAVKATIDGLIESASSFDFDALERIYHDDMAIFMFGPEGDVQRADKPGFIKHVTEGTNKTETPLTWAKYHHVVADDQEGHVVISRKVNLTGEVQIVTLSIDLVFEDDRWQITREVIRVGG